MIRLKQAIIVEGRYDKARLENIFDALIIETRGFSIYSDPDMRRLIKRLADGDGIIILTDSDKSGFRIRACIRSFTAGGNVTDVYLPDIPGREKRKRTSSSEGLLGAEGIPDAIILEAFRRAGLTGESEPPHSYGKQLLTELGLCGGADSARLRRLLAGRLSLPANMNSNALSRTLPRILSEQELRTLAAELRTPAKDADGTK